MKSRSETSWNVRWLLCDTSRSNRSLIVLKNCFIICFLILETLTMTQDSVESRSKSQYIYSHIGQAATSRKALKDSDFVNAKLARNSLYTACTDRVTWHKVMSLPLWIQLNILASSFLRPGTLPSASSLVDGFDLKPNGAETEKFASLDHRKISMTCMSVEDEKSQDEPTPWWHRSPLNVWISHGSGSHPSLQSKYRVCTNVKRPHSYSGHGLKSCPCPSWFKIYVDLTRSTRSVLRVGFVHGQN